MPIEINVLVSPVAAALGAFAAGFPRRAAQIWGSQRLYNLTPERRPLFSAGIVPLGYFFSSARYSSLLTALMFSQYRP